MSRVSSQNCRSAWILGGVWGYLSHVRYLSPPRMRFLHGIRSFSWTVSLSPSFPLGTLQIIYHRPQCPPLVDWAVLSFMKCSLYRQCTWTEFILSEHNVSTLCCQKLGGQAPGICHTFSHCFLVSEDNFCMALEVGCQAAALHQLVVMLDGNLVTGCPHTMDPTLDAKFVSQVSPLPSGEMAHALDPW